jgi:hypothetical protein
MNGLLMTKERPAESDRWIFASQFPSAEDALRCYEQARDLILVDDLAASVFRFTVRDTSYVAVLGDRPLSGVDFRNIAEVLSSGEPTGVPEQISDHLRQRRQRFEELRVDFLERRRRDIPDA